MRLHFIIGLSLSLLLTGCFQRGPNPDDPYEKFNRKIYRFNQRTDRLFIKPPAKLYKKIFPAFVRKGINNFYNNLDMVPTIGNDILQAEFKWAIKDFWRLVINSSLGFGGFVDEAQFCGLPPHSNDLGLTLAKWGDKNSPYLLLPILGPSTIRDGMGMLFQFALYSPYVYIPQEEAVWGLLVLRTVDLRAQLMDAEALMDEALDRYAFMRDAYLQHRRYLMTGVQEDTGELYIDEAVPAKT